MDPLARSLDVTRSMLRGALWAFKQEAFKGASEQRVRAARENLVFWRERYETLLRARESMRRSALALARPVLGAHENGSTPKQSAG